MSSRTNLRVILENNYETCLNLKINIVYDFRNYMPEGILLFTLLPTLKNM